MAGKKSKISYLKLIVVGCIWTVVYLQMMAVVCFSLLGFNPLSVSAWMIRFSAFVNSKWIINTAFDFALFLVMILFIPLWILGWWGLYSVHWKRLIPRRLLEKKVKAQSLKIASSKKTFVPNKLRVQSSALLSVSPTTSSDMPSISQGGYDYSQSYPDSADTVPDTQRTEGFPDENDIQAILPLTSRTPADFFPHISIDGNYATFALSNDSRAIVVRVINQPNSTWSVDTETDIQESNWYCESHILETPVKEIMAITKSLLESEPNSVAIPVILMMSGTLMNPLETFNYLGQNNIMLLRLDGMHSKEIPLFKEFLDEYFGTKTDALPEGMIPEDG